jgi:hypothetical protein
MAGVCRPTAVAFTHTIGGLAAPGSPSRRAEIGDRAARRHVAPTFRGARTAPAGTAVIARHPGGLAHYFGRT